MINLKIEKYCENCDEFEPEVDKNDYVTEDFKTMTMLHITNTTVKCKHAQRCQGMVNYLKDRDDE